MKKVLYILSVLNDLDVDWLVAHGLKARIPKGTALIEEGRPIDALHIVLEGSLRVTAGRANTELARAGAGEILGEISFIDSRPPLATATAVEDSIVLSIPRRKLEAQLKQDSGLAARFYHAVALFLADRLRTTTRHLGYGTEAPTPEERDVEDELAPQSLDAVSVGGARFDRLLKKMLGA
jgi:CRP/FNR family cyclic AMP-dependent transcriptional regulator